MKQDHSGRTRGATLVVALLCMMVAVGGCGDNHAVPAPIEVPSGPTASARGDALHSADTTRGPIYYVELNFWTAHVKAYLNGLPLYRKKVPNSGFYSAAVNANLVGKGNTLRIRLEPLMIEKRAPVPGTDSMRLSTLEDADLYGSVKRYGPEEAVAGEGHGEVVAEFDLQEIVEQRRETLQQQFHEALQKASPQERVNLAEQEAERVTPTLPLEFEVTFDSEDAPSFRERLQDAPVIENEDAVLDYAIYLRDLMREQATKRLWTEVLPKNKEYDTAYYENTTIEWWRDVLQNKYYPGEIVIEFERKHLATRKFCGGRIWEVYVQADESIVGYYPEVHPEKGQALLSTKGENGQIWAMEIFVGNVDGELKVVR